MSAGLLRRSAALAVFGVGCWAGGAFAQEAAPAVALLEALADPDPGHLTQFVDTHFSFAALAAFPASAWAHSLSIVAAESGGVDGLALTDTAGDVSVKGRTRRGAVPVAGHVWLDREDPGKIRGLQLTRDLTARSAGAPQWPNFAVDDRAVAAAVEAEVAWRSATDRFSGVVLVAHYGDVLIERAVGWADAAHNRHNKPSSRFALASLTKMFTAVAVAQLVEADRISLDEPIGRLLADFPDSELASQITPRQLLSHTSGLGDLSLDAPAVWRDFERGAGPTAMLRHLADVRQEFRPGTGYHYSNAGYLTLGALIEAAGRDAYVERIRTHVFVPAGMLDAVFPAPGQLPDRASEGLTFQEDDPLGFRPRISNGKAEPIFSSPAAGAYGTAEDLFHFVRALQAGRLISPDDVRRFTTGFSPTWDRLGLYGLGFIERRTPAGRMFGHAGGAGSVGINDVVWTSDNGAWTVIVLSNYDAPIAVDLGTQILDFVMQKTANAATR